MVTAPLVMPEVITGLSLLLLFVAMAQLVGWPAERGMLTIWIAHTTFCTAYVAIVVSARLRGWISPLRRRPWTWEPSPGRCSS